MKLVLDTSCVYHFARAARLDDLRRVVEHCGEAHVVPAVVRELERQGRDDRAVAAALAVDWLTKTSALPHLLHLVADYAQVLDPGEAETLALAEEEGIIAIVDERAGNDVGGRRGVEVHGTLWLVGRGVAGSVLGPDEADRIVEDLRRTGARFPDMPNGFCCWAREEGVL